MTAEQATHFSEMRKLAASIGPRIEHCRREGQLSCGAHLHEARESLHKAIHSYKPECDERQLSMELERA